MATIFKKKTGYGKRGTISLSKSELKKIMNGDFDHIHVEETDTGNTVEADKQKIIDTAQQLPVKGKRGQLSDYFVAKYK